MRIDYIRVYQPTNAINIGCDPEGFPTKAYINQWVGYFGCSSPLSNDARSLRYIEAYSNPNLTTWVDDYQQPWPKNSFLGQC
jgi:beta-glucan synthesis-associated protein KRE6